MNIDIDKKSGFCFGVVYAIQKAEEILENNETLYCLGDIVHNGVEVDRLKKKGLITIDHKQLKELKNCKVLIRAHGEPPETYKTILENNIELIDASCPVVLKLQNNIQEGHQKSKEEEGQLVIYGKKGHAEVNGLVGQTQNKAIVIENENDLHLLDFSKPIRLYSQTTKSISGLQKIKTIIEERQKEAGQIQLIYNDTICRQVASRGDYLPKFAKEHSIIIFVSGKKSSNGKALFSICKQENERSYFVSEIKDIDLSWFKKDDNIGICGATSTPAWLMKAVSEFIKEQLID